MIDKEALKKVEVTDGMEDHKKLEKKTEDVMGKEDSKVLTR